MYTMEINGETVLTSTYRCESIGGTLGVVEVIESG